MIVKQRKMRKRLKKFKIVFFFLPFAAGATGYLAAGEMLTDALYSAVCLYVMNPVSDAYNILIEIARWAAPLTTATALLYAFTKLMVYFRWRVGCLFHDSVAVYTDSDIRILFGSNVRKIYGSEIKHSAKSHIILMEHDADSFDFYDKHREELKGRKVYIGLHEMELGLMKENADISYFDISGTISRLLWKKIRVWERYGDDPVKIVIWGNGALAEHILSYGLLLNLYSPKQHLCYIMAGCDGFRIKHPELPLMNGDEIRFLPGGSEDAWRELSDADIVIMTEEMPASDFQTAAVCARNAELYYFSRHEGDIGDILAAGAVTAFGRDAEIYTDEWIRQEKLIEEAKEMNRAYAEEYGGQADWGALSGFLKWSNISAADYRRVLKEVMERNPSWNIDTFAELEHNRWCRFHYLNYWKYGVPANGKSKDERQRIHSLLKPYGELSEDDKQKNVSAVQKIRELKL